MQFSRKKCDLGSGHSWAVANRPHARHYAHTGMVGLDGHKMSKSRGNLVLVSKLRAAGVDPAAIRLAIMSQHYRSDWFWTDELLERAIERLDLFRRAVAVADGDDDSAALEALDRTRALLAQDLDAPAALDELQLWAEDAVVADERAATGEGERIGGGALIADILSARFGVSL